MEISEFEPRVEIEYEQELEDDECYREIFGSISTPGSLMTYNYEVMAKDLSYSQIKLVDFENNEFYIKRDEKTNLINDLTTCFPSDIDFNNQNSSPRLNESLDLNSVTIDPEFMRKLHVGHTPFTEKFKNSPLCKGSSRLRLSSMFRCSRLCEESSQNVKKLVESSENKVLMKYIIYGNCQRNPKKDNKTDDNSNLFQIQLMFLHFFYLNERSIVLRVIDQSGFGYHDVEGQMNENYISAYNCFHFLAAFSDIAKIDSYNGIKYYRAKNRFDSKFYCIKVSCYNQNDIRTFHKTSHALRKEILILSRLTHDNILRYYSSWIEYQVLYEQVEYNMGKSLEEIKYCFSNEAFEIKYLSLFAAKHLVLQISSALIHLHSQWKHVHNDIIPYKILLFPPASMAYNECDGGLIESLLNETSDFRITFKLSGFENCIPMEIEDHCNKDIEDLADVTVEAIGEDPTNWKYMSPSKLFKLKRFDNFVLMLLETVLGHTKTADHLAELARSSLLE